MGIRQGHPRSIRSSTTQEVCLHPSFDGVICRSLLHSCRLLSGLIRSFILFARVDMKPRLNLTGQRFGRLVATSSVEGYSPTKWRCMCDCGAEVIVRTISLRSGNTTSCGCSRASHKASSTPTYRSWLAMRHRRNKPAYKDIPVCKRWEKFEAFLADMGERPNGTTLDRKNNRKGYFPSNCRWATKQQQSANRRSSLFFSYAGKTLCIAEWAREIGMHEDTLRRRLKRGMPIGTALTTPVKEQK